MDTEIPRKILLWNVGGISKIFNLDSKTFDKLVEYSIIGIVETWSKKNVQSGIFKKFNIYEVNAVTHVSGKGRPGGGLALLIKKDIIKEVEVVGNSTFYIAVRIIDKKNKKWLVILTYITPAEKNFESIIEDILITKRYAMEKYAIENVIWLGDFNARLGSMSAKTNDTWCINNKRVKEHRISEDFEINKKGKIINESIIEENLVLLNGRVDGDKDGKYTFCNYKGNSVIDLCIVSESVAENVYKFEILDWSDSEHFPCSIEIVSNRVKYYDSTKKTRLVWDNEAKEKYSNVTENLIKNYPTNLSYGNIVDIIRKAAEQSGQCKQVYHNATSPNKKWYDKDCVILKKDVNCKLKLARKSGWNSDLRQEYLIARKLYNEVRKKKKLNYLIKLQDKFHNIKYATEFWKVVKSYKYTEFVENNIDNQTWIDFYEKTQRKGEILLGNFHDVRQEFMDINFTASELHVALRKLSNGKAAGPDLISNEFLKNSSTNLRGRILDMFNAIWEKEDAPQEWSGSETVMIYKKGDKSDPANYRPISLLNTNLKLFTTMIQNRLAKWADENKIIPDCQMGFRKGKGCMDHIFNLKALLQIGTRRNTVYAVFIDFSRCFNSIIHKRLWEKLYLLGVSGKIIRILRLIYDRAYTKVRLKEGLSDEIKVIEGVLQGESMSPILFNLYLSEIESKLKNWNIPGIKIEGDEIHALLFADDSVILAPGAGSLQRKLDQLASYFDELGLMVNISKTKVMRFRRRQRKKNESFYFKGEKLEIVSEYTYLGVKFRENILDKETSKHFKTKGKAAISKIDSIIFKGRAESIIPKLKLFDSVIVPTCLYGAHIWGLNEVDEIEKVQSFYLKRCLGLKTCVSNAAVRLECDRLKLSRKIISILLSFLIKIWKSNENDYIKKCYNQLYRNSKIVGEEVKYNWCLKVKEIFDLTGFSHIWHTQNLQELLAGKEHILNKLDKILKDEDIDMVSKSKTYQYYGKIFDVELDRTNFYLNVRIGNNIAKCLAQTRMGNGSFWFSGYCIELKINELCTLCGKENENMMHVLFNCKIHEGARRRYIKEYIMDCKNEMDKYVTVLANLDDMKLRNVFLYMQHVVSYRNMILNLEKL